MAVLPVPAALPPLQYLGPDAPHPEGPPPHTRPGHNGFRAWIFVINNPTDDTVQRLPRLEDPLWPGLVKYVYQLEQGANGTPHIQGYVNFGQTQKSFSFLRHASRLGNAHLEPARGTPQQNYDYCTKLDGRLGEPVFGGFANVGDDDRGRSRRIPRRAQIVSLIQANPNITRAEIIAQGGLDVLVDKPNIIGLTRSLLRDDERNRGVVCYLFYGPSGSGKSRLARHLFSDCYSKSSGKWWDYYAGESTVIFDDFDAAFLGIGDILRYVDRYSCYVECKNGTLPLAANRFIFTSNLLPSQWFAEAGPRIAAIHRRIDFVTEFLPDNKTTVTTKGDQYWRNQASPFDVPPIVSRLPWADELPLVPPTTHFGNWQLFDPNAPYLPVPPVPAAKSIPITSPVVRPWAA